MSLFCLSYSHQHVNIDFRERVYFDHNAIANACARFRCGGEKLPGIQELSILSTCNRTEVYAFSNDNIDGFSETRVTREKLLSFVGQARGLENRSLDNLAHWKHGPSVVGHLCRVASGLESLVLGEPQILGQVGDAMRLGLIMNATGPVLTRLFQTALRCGRRARTETEIGRHSLNVSTVAVNSAERELGELTGKTVVVLGAGDMADLALAQLQKKGIGEIRIVNRTIAKARELSEKYRAHPHVFEQINEVLPLADILITSTGAPHTLITSDMIHDAMQRRPDRKMMILDIALPRDVETAAGSISNVQLCDIDDLQMCTGQSIKIRESQIPHVERMIDFEVDRFLNWYRGVGIEETVGALRRKAESLRTNEVERLFGMLPDMDGDQAAIIEQFSRSLVNKLLHHPTTGLRDLQGTRSAVDYGEAIRELFQLETSHEAQRVEAGK